MNITFNDLIPVSVHIPLDEIRARMNESPYDHEIIVNCLSGQSSYFVCKILAQNELRVLKVADTFKKWKTAVSTD